MPAQMNKSCRSSTRAHKIRPPSSAPSSLPYIFIIYSQQHTYSHTHIILPHKGLIHLVCIFEPVCMCHTAHRIMHDELLRILYPHRTPRCAVPCVYVAFQEVAQRRRSVFCAGSIWNCVYYLQYFLDNGTVYRVYNCAMFCYVSEPAM